MENYIVWLKLLIVIQTGEKEGPQTGAAEVVGSRMTIHDVTVATVAIVLDADETTPTDPMVRDLILD